MKKAIKYLGFSMVSLVVLFFIVANISAKVSSYQCAGEITENAVARPMTVYIKMEEYRPWVGLWSNSGGNVKLEIPNVVYEYYDRVDKVGEQRQIYRRDRLAGNFSTLSKTLALDVGFFGFFDGVCTITN